MTIPREDPSSLPADAGFERLDLFEADLDDESPEVLAHAAELLLAAGALDVVRIPIVMKKGRAGTRIEVLARPEQRGAVLTILLRETSTLGVRRRETERCALARDVVTVVVEGVPVRVKRALWNGRVLKAKAEYEDCRLAAERTGRTLRDVMAAARAAAREDDGV